MRHLLQNPIDVSETARLEYIYEATTSARLDLIMRQQGTRCLGVSYGCPSRNGRSKRIGSQESFG